MTRWALAGRLAAESGLARATVNARLARGWTEHEAALVPLQDHMRHGVAHGEIARRARRNGIPAKTAYERIADGWPMARAVSEPVRARR